MQFIAARGSLCSTSKGMMVQTLTATGAAWKTADGLAVGDPVAKLERLYPSAKAHPGVDWLVKIDRGSGHALLTAVSARAGSPASRSPRTVPEPAREPRP